MPPHGQVLAGILKGLALEKTEKTNPTPVMSSMRGYCHEQVFYGISGTPPLEDKREEGNEFVPSKRFYSDHKWTARL